MKRSWWTRFTFLLIVTVVSVMMIMPTFVKFAEDSGYPVKSKINLGLDLQGGLYMILGIDFKKVYKDEVANYARKIEFVLKDQGITAKMGDSNIEDPDDPSHSIVLADDTTIDKAKETIREYFPSILRLTNENGPVLTYALTKVERSKIEEQSVSKSIEVIRNRIDEFGVTEPEIVSQGTDRIVVQLPGVRDIDRAKELIGKTAKLEFKLVNNEVPFSNLSAWLEKAKAEGIVFKKGERFSTYLENLNTFLKKDLPDGSILAFERKINPQTNEVISEVPYVVDAAARINGDNLQDARVLIDQQKNEPYVSLEFKPQGAKLFEDLTGENVGRNLAIILDGNVYSAPTIQTRIGGGRAQITLGQGGFNKIMQEARDLALVLRAGALPVQLDFLEQRTVGASLGADSIKRAEIAGIIGSAIVFLFMFIYYRISGGIAVLTLIVNVLIILACLVGLEATLTLPGIAGIALTVGMA
ncbi:MAG: protein translocase subunit SecD, partial [Bdellovibrionales bacterium CG22_combo_CG10-13_8_21_14_all_38_13]